MGRDTMENEAGGGPRPPRQERSRRTLRNLERAGLELVARHGAEAVTVADVVARARSSVGSFYARFAGKEELFRHLDGLLWREAGERWRRSVEDREVASPVEELDHLASFLVEEEEKDGFLRRSLRGSGGGGEGRDRFLDEVEAELGPRLGVEPRVLRTVLRMSLAALAAVGTGGPEGVGADGGAGVAPAEARRHLRVLLGGLLSRDREVAVSVQGAAGAGGPLEGPSAPKDSKDGDDVVGPTVEPEEDSGTVDPFDVWG